MSAWLPIQLDAIPPELRALGWIGWRATLEDGGWKKKPYQIGAPSQLAANNAPDQWRSEGDVREIRSMDPDRFDGFGVALTRGIVFVDLDDVRTPDTGVIVPWANKVIDLFDSWTEISVSGAGVHIFCRATLPSSGLVGCIDGVPDYRIEVYERGRFAYLTGHVLEAKPIAERQRLVTLLTEHVRPPNATGPARPRREDESEAIPMGARNDTLFRIARSLRRHGLEGMDLAHALLKINQRRCQPPLTDAEVFKLAQHAERLPDREPNP